MSMSGWEDSAVQHWQATARQQQEDRFAAFGDSVWWSGVAEVQETDLQYVIGSALFGPAPYPGQNLIRFSGYPKHDIRLIKNMSYKVKHHFKQSETFLSVVFVCTKGRAKEKVQVVLRVWDAHKELYVDSESRTYHSWQQFVLENTYSRVFMCFPTNGRYTRGSEAGLELEFALSPAWKPRARVLRAVDITLFVIFVTGMAICSALLENDIDIPILLYVGAALFFSGSLYLLIRFLYFVYDAYRHF